MIVNPKSKPTRTKQKVPIRSSDAPQIIKYMGSKAKILDFVVAGINSAYAGGGVCDLFAGSGIVGGAVGRSVRVFSNDIQAYSRALAGYYLEAWLDPATFRTAEEIANEVQALTSSVSEQLPQGVSYGKGLSLKRFNAVEDKNRALLHSHFTHPYHLFTKYYSGTWWSAQQCIWIDAIREVADRYRDTPSYSLIIVSLMHAMAYCGSGTGHYAQYRDAKTESSLRDIANYRQRSIKDYFVRKYTALAARLPHQPPHFKHEITALDYRERLSTLPRCTVYADPPYAFVHYSRFYHAIETVYLYDYPKLQVVAGEVVKGRYRDSRHQSPFCIRTQVPQAFVELFTGTAESKSNLVLSYSNTGMIEISDLQCIARTHLPKYDISLLRSDHKHMTMGRRADRHRDVEEVLLLAKRR